MSSFKPQSFDKTPSIDDYPEANDDKFRIPKIIQECYVDAAKDREEMAARIREEAEQIANVEIERLKEEAYQEGLEKGRQESLQITEEERIKTIEEHKEALQKILQELNDQKAILLEDNSDFFYELIGEICKKIIGKYIDYDQESLGRWLVSTCDELSHAEELTLHTSEKYQEILEKSMEYLKSHRVKFPQIKMINDQNVDQIIVETKQIDIINNFNEQIDSVVQLIKS